MNFIDSIVQALIQAGTYDKNDQVPPASVLWTDKERQWEPLLPLLRSRLHILTLGEYMPAQRSGPSYWLRCMLARSLPEEALPPDVVPILYLPGVSRADLRAVEDCPLALQPLAELQYRGVLWTQKNGHDWTPAAYLQSNNGGLGIEVAGDQATRESLKRALLKLADEPLATLNKQSPLKAAYFDALLNPDEVRSLLLWLNNPTEFKAKQTSDEWQAFCSISKSKYGLHPEKDGPISGAQLLGLQNGPWKAVWNRFIESPSAYPGLPLMLRQACPTQPGLFDLSESWPQHNEYGEEQLLQQLEALSAHPAGEVRVILGELEVQHGERRGWVWSRLGQARLAVTLEHMVILAKLTEKSLVGPNLAAIEQAYLEWGWQVDQAALQALAAIQTSGSKAEEIAAVKTAVRAVFQPWLEESAITMQKAILQGSGVDSYTCQALPIPEKGTCLLFSDALRLDLGQRLAGALREIGYPVEVRSRRTALPTVTATAKAALCPTPNPITGAGAKELAPVQAGKETALAADGLRKILQDKGFQTLSEDDLGDPSGLGWVEMGDIDSYGHGHGCKLALQIENELLLLHNRITTLLNYGWKRVIVVTDHGWLLLPGGLPKAHLPEHLTDIRKGRCARVKSGMNSSQQEVPWYWDSTVRVAIAPNIRCYEEGKEYEHGGISPQECFTPMLVISRADAETETPVKIESAGWKGLRLTVKLSGTKPDLTVDIRSKAGDAGTSLVAEPKAPNANGEVSLLVEDEDRLETAAFIVVLGVDGQPRAQQMTTIGI